MRSIYIMYKLKQSTFGEEVIHHSIMLCSNPIRWNCTKYETGSNWPIWTDLSFQQAILWVLRGTISLWLYPKFTFASWIVSFVQRLIENDRIHCEKIMDLRPPNCPWFTPCLVSVNICRIGAWLDADWIVWFPLLSYCSVLTCDMHEFRPVLVFHSFSFVSSSSYKYFICFSCIGFTLSQYEFVPCKHYKISEAQLF